MMPGIEIRGFEELRRNAERFSKSIAANALRAAEDAAALVVKAGMEHAAPRGSHVRRRNGFIRIAKSIIIYEARALRSLTESGNRRLLVGPSSKAPHAFWLEKGWLAMGRRRRARIATATTHSQSGTPGGKRIAGRPWAAAAAHGIEAEAFEAGSKAFQAVVERETGSLA